MPRRACLPADRPYPFLPQPLQTRSRRNRLRNRVLGRPNTPEEEAYLAADGPPFGQ